MADRLLPNPSPEGEGLFFTQSALRLSALSALLLGWRPGEFWDATPAELHAILSEMERGQKGAAPPAPAEMARLQEMFPDG